MKRLWITLAIILTIYIIFIDLNEGTLLSTENEDNSSIAAQASPSSSNNKYFEKKVEAGDTLITIIEDQSNKTLPVSIDQLVSDFKNLNDNLAPEDIQVGKTYYFPIYPIVAP